MRTEKDLPVLIRDAHSEDPSILFAAEKETAQTPGLLVSRPDELRLGEFAKKIAELSQIGDTSWQNKLAESWGMPFSTRYR
jgi:hypothetical protein